VFVRSPDRLNPQELPLSRFWSWSVSGPKQLSLLGVLLTIVFLSVIPVAAAALWIAAPLVTAVLPAIVTFMSASVPAPL